MDWIQKDFEEYYLFQFDEKGVKPRVLRDLTEQLTLGKLKLSESGAGIVLDKVRDAFLGQKFHLEATAELKQKDLHLMEAFLGLLEVSVELCVRLDHVGPNFVKAGFPLRAFLVHQRQDFKKVALQVVRFMIEALQKFSDWRSFVLEDAAGVVARVIAAELGDTKPAKEAPNASRLAIRKEISMANDIMEDVNAKEKFSADVGAQQVVEDVATVLDKILNMTHDQIFDILDKGERLAAASVKSALKGLLDLVKDQRATSASIKEAHTVMVKAQENLVKIQRGRRNQRLDLVRGRLKFLDSLLAGTLEADEREMVEKYKSNLGDQTNAIDKLGRVYNIYARGAHLTDVSDELMFLDSQISSLYEVAISIVVFGVIKVGKSTILNCILEEDLSPHRISTMTAIPTRFIHDPKVTIPTMLVPFADELNSVVAKLRELVSRSGLASYEGLLNSDLGKLVGKLYHSGSAHYFLPEYVGKEQISEVSSDIHDLFRLSVNDIFQGELVQELSIDWGRGLESYLTVTLPFPEMRLLSGLVKFSVIDSPGINEAEVRKLNLHNTVKGALKASNFGIVVCINDGTMAAEGYRSIKETAKSVRGKYHTPMMALATHSETSEQSDERRAAIAQALSEDPKNPTFQPQEVAFVSGLRMMVALAILAQLKKTGQKPVRGDPATAKIVSDFYFIAGDGFNQADKMKWYDDLTLEELIKVANRLKKASGVPYVVQHIVKTTVVEGIPLVIRTASEKVKERVGETLELYQNPSSRASLLQAQADAAIEFHNLQKAVEQIQRDLSEKKREIRGAIEKRVKQVMTDLTNLEQSPLTKGAYDTFLGLLDVYVKNITLSETRELVYATGSVTFEDDKASQAAVLELNGTFKKAVEDFLVQPVQKMPSDLVEWSRAQQSVIESQLHRIRAVITARLNAKLPKLPPINMVELFQEAVSTQVYFAPPKAQKDGVLATIGKTLAWFLGWGYSVKAPDARKDLAKKAKAVVLHTEEVLKEHVERSFRELSKILIQDIVSDATALADLANSKVFEAVLIHAFVAGAEAQGNALQDQMLHDLAVIRSEL